MLPTMMASPDGLHVALQPNGNLTHPETFIIAIGALHPQDGYLMNHERLLSTHEYVKSQPSSIRKASTFPSQVQCRTAYLKGRIQRPVLLLWRMTACGLRDALPSNCQTFTVSSLDRDATLLEPAAGNWCSLVCTPLGQRVSYCADNA